MPKVEKIWKIEPKEGWCLVKYENNRYHISSIADRESPGSKKELEYWENPITADDALSEERAIDWFSVPSEIDFMRAAIAGQKEEFVYYPKQNIKVTTSECTCNIKDLWNYGCRCGAMK